VDRQALYTIARRHGLRVVEDAAQSMGSRFNGAPIGAQGDLVSISFHTNKNITTIEGGCLVVNDEREALLAEQYRLQGVVRSGFDGMEVEVAGGKFNLTDVAARVGLGQLPHLAQFNARRRELARLYFAQLRACGAESLGLGLPVQDWTNSNWHMFQVVLPEERLDIARAQVMEQLLAAGIGSGVHYPAMHLFALYRRLGFRPGDFPVAEYTGRNILTLPLFPAMRDTDVSRVAEALMRILLSAARH
jgi:dTDP-4-amino-4,6-dideoxygalactose transaminase